MLLEPAKNETGGAVHQKGVPKKFANNSAGIPLLSALPHVEVDSRLKRSVISLV